jgi:putative membrane protein
MGEPSLAWHMGLHIALMNLVAPALAYALMRARPSGPGDRMGESLLVALVVQLALLWGWHAPAPLSWSLRSMPGHLIMQASLLAASVWFWRAVFAAPRWRAMAALLTTGKLFCLLGLFLAVAPAPLYGVAIEDQQLAGLMMIVVCPVSYILVALGLAALWLRELERAPQGARTT